MCEGSLHRAGVELTMQELVLIQGLAEQGIAPVAGRLNLPARSSCREGGQPMVPTSRNVERIAHT